jgi:thymidylate synthase (FAD)
MFEIIKVLNHGHVRLVDHMGSDLSIVRNARVSYDSEWRAGEDKGSDTRLINYLYKNGHNTPFESVTITFDVKAPIFVLRQWHRHRTQSYNELSARYRELPNEWYVPEPHLIGKQNADNKQMRDVLTEQEFEKLGDMEKSQMEHYSRHIGMACAENYNKYMYLISQGVPRELARGILPLNMYSHMFATMNLHNLFRFLGERLHPHAQYEIRVYAEAMLELIKPIVPVATEVFMNNVKNY